MKGYLIIKFIGGEGVMYEVNSTEVYENLVTIANKKFGNKILEMKFMKNVITTNKIDNNLLGKLNNTVVIIKGDTGYLNKNEKVKLKVINGGKSE